jgi:hypothetical protein
MNRQFALLTIAIAGIIFVAVTTFAQRRPHDQLMKEIDVVSASLKKNLDGTGAQGVDEIILNERGGLIRIAQARKGKPPSEEQIQASAAAALEDAAKLQALMKEIQQFWASVDANDAVDFAKSAQAGATTVVEKIKSKDFDGAQVAFGTVRETCRDCHFAHRETTGKGFIIKP